MPEGDRTGPKGVPTRGRTERAIRLVRPRAVARSALGNPESRPACARFPGDSPSSAPAILQAALTCGAFRECAPAWRGARAKPSIPGRYGSRLDLQQSASGPIALSLPRLEELLYLGLIEHPLAYPEHARPEPRLGVRVREQRARLARRLLQPEICGHHQDDIHVPRIGAAETKLPNTIKRSSRPVRSASSCRCRSFA